MRRGRSVLASELCRLAVAQQRAAGKVELVGGSSALWAALRDTPGATRDLLTSAALVSCVSSEAISSEHTRLRSPGDNLRSLVSLIRHMKRLALSLLVAAFGCSGSESTEVERTIAALSATVPDVPQAVAELSGSAALQEITDSGPYAS